MPAWELVATQVLVTVGTVSLVLWSFWKWVVRPYLDRKVAELVAAAQEIEPAVTRGVRKGVSETLRDLPESALDGAVKESTRQVRKFGAGLFENGLSSFLGNASDVKRKSPGVHGGSKPPE
ncbi:hypothetical protein BKP64_05190 [Marinobacter salinus]|uniref:Uncharacterized protein n=1 Tax=Marinobacter salinus TaxID=1874317 RepID=A0A1D9GJ28_9GAMM|nr:hypothetical protein [Marinobacter salinus]AOY87613.1 hypothetical protein BKP64_05190 [Marinobacter salinus]